jgi:hypothetical protein
VDELESLVDLERYNPALPTGHPFNAVQAFVYWSSSSYADYTYGAWYVYMGDGHVGSSTKDGSFYV